MRGPARCFVALRPAGSLEQELTAALAPWAASAAAVRWVPADRRHLTLRFLGAVERPAVDRVATALRAVRSPQLRLGLSGFGAFPARGRPRVLWAGVTGDLGTLEALAGAISVALEPLGFAPEKRAFHPHLTIARVVGWRGVDLLLGEMAARQWASTEVTVESFALFESELRPDGARYTEIERYRMA